MQCCDCLLKVKCSSFGNECPNQERIIPEQCRSFLVDDELDQFNPMRRCF